jgi:Cdc6-like AAA superfamily ATPase
LHYAEKLGHILKTNCSASDPPDSVKQLCETTDIEQSLKWFVESQEYKVWTQASSAKLWVHGEPGDGKTVLMSYILRSLSQGILPAYQQDIASIFCSSNDTEVGIIASLVCQLLKGNKVRAKAAQKYLPITEFEQCEQSGGPRGLLWRLLRLLITATDDSETVFVIDAIDKLGPHVRSSFLGGFLRVQNDIGAQSADMRVIISSLMIEDVQSALSNYSRIDREMERRGGYQGSMIKIVLTLCCRLAKNT